jgi:hypothetical protein
MPSCYRLRSAFFILVIIYIRSYLLYMSACVVWMEHSEKNNGQRERELETLRFVLNQEICFIAIKAKRNCLLNKLRSF